MHDGEMTWWKPLVSSSRIVEPRNTPSETWFIQLGMSAKPASGECRHTQKEEESYTIIDYNVTPQMDNVHGV